MPVAAGASNLYFTRDIKVYLKQGTNIWEVPILEGASFSQSTNTSEITLQEMTGPSGINRRGKAVFTDSFAPAEWSFSTYVRPFLASSLQRAVEEPLWANFVAVNSFNPTGAVWDKGVTRNATDLKFDFDDSNTTLLGEFELYFVLGGNNAPDRNYEADGDTAIYRISGAVVNEVSIQFEAEGIATLQWSGFGGLLRELTTFDASTAILGGIANSNNFIRNRLTQLTATSSVSGTSKDYKITLTGGNITISNGITYLTPEVLGKVNAPLGHITGGRSVTGNFTCYVDEETDGSMDLFEDISLAIEQVRNEFELDFYVGGKDGVLDAPLAPGMHFKMPQAHLSLPNMSLDDVVSFDVEFTALPTNISGTNEITFIGYRGIA